MQSQFYCRVVCVVATVLVPLSVCQAQFLRLWVNSAGGSFNTGANWDDFQVPGPNDGAVFGPQATYTVSFPTNVTNSSARINSGTVTWDLDTSGTARTYTAGALSINGSAAPLLVIRDGTVSTASVRAHSTGRLRLGPTLGEGTNHPSATLNVSGDFEVSSGGEAVINDFFNSVHLLNVSGNVLVDGGTFRRVGSASAATDTTGNRGFRLAAGRTLTVQNAGSFDSSGTFRLTQGSTVQVLSGARAQFAGLDIASAAGAGSLLVEGVNSRVTMSPSFTSNDEQRWGAGGNAANALIQGGGRAELTGGLQLASDGSAASATFTVDGPGTVFEQKNVGAGGAPDHIVVGHASAGSATINVRNGAVFTAESGTSGSSRVIINATGQINVESGATFAASWIQRSGGQLNVTGGNLRFDNFIGNLVNQSGKLIPGHLLGSGNSAGIDGNFTQQSNASLQIGIGGVLPGQASSVFVNGNAILGGSLDLTLIDEFVPVIGNSFTVLQTQFGNIGGKFDRVNGALPLPGLGLAVTYSSTQVTVRAAIPGDANLDGTVNLSDFNALAANFGQAGRTWVQADFNGDGIVNLQDFNRLAANFGLSAGGPDVTPDDWANLSSAVPEPGVGAILCTVCAGLVLHRRRRGV